MRRLSFLGRVLASGDALVAIALLTAVIVIFPPRHPGPELGIIMAATVVLTVTALRLLHWVVGPARARRMGSWTRASVALATSCSVLMMTGAAAAVLR